MPRARARNFQESDRIRDELAKMGVVLKDTKDGTHLGDRAMTHPRPCRNSRCGRCCRPMCRCWRRFSAPRSRNLTADDYSEAQQEAWASAADDEEEFGAKLAGELTLVATFGGAAVGFASLADNTRIDMLYVHPAAAGQGAGAMLVRRAGKARRRARRQGTDGRCERHRARLFREARLFGKDRNTVSLGGEWLANTTMAKPLAAKEAAP